MAKKPQRVHEFLDRLKSSLQKKNQSDLQILLNLKKQDDPSATTVNPWDWRYYANIYRKKQFQIDPQFIKEYFPADHVLTQVFALYEKLLGVRFQKQPQSYGWAPEVQLYSIQDTRSKKTVGYFYLDLYPRDNKYKHFAAFDIIKGRLQTNGSYRPPVAAMVANFPRATETQPSLLTHNDVETLFHEFGHIMHQTLTRAPYASLAGSNVRGDFVEAPSQMLENWVWQPRILKKLSRHYTTKEPLPDQTIAQMIASKHAMEGIFWTRQLFFGLIDMVYHDRIRDFSHFDSTGLWQQLYELTTGMKALPSAQPQASFGHLMGGYQAGYYGYLWSKVFSEDMFTLFQRQGLENAKTGARYRKAILEPGGCAEPDLLLRDFLGRAPRLDAFEKSLGIK